MEATVFMLFTVLSETPLETTVLHRAGTCHYLKWIKLKIKGDLNHHLPPPVRLPSYRTTPRGIMFSDSSSIVQIWGRLFYFFHPLWLRGWWNFGTARLYLVLHITTVFSFPQGDQKSQSAKAKKSSAGDGKGSLTRIFKMVKLFSLFSQCQEWSRTENRFRPYRLTVCFLLSCLSDEISSRVSNRCARGSAYSMCICSICFVDILISLQHRLNNYKRLLEAMIKAISFMPDMLIQSQCSRATANIYTDHFLKYEYI